MIQAWRKLPVGAVPKAWVGETAVILASGPSLTQADAEYVRGKARTIAVNSSYKMAPWADVLYAADRRWWDWEKGAPDFMGMKFGLNNPPCNLPGVTLLRCTGCHGLEQSDASGLKSGRNSGYQAIGLAHHFGAKRILLLGYDMRRVGRKEHWHEDHPNNSRSPFHVFIRCFDSIVEPLKAAGVEVINCTKDSALGHFPYLPLREALP